MDLVDLAVQAVDGTKVVASASSRRSYDAEGLARLLERLERAIAELEDQKGRKDVNLTDQNEGPGRRTRTFAS